MWTQANIVSFREFCAKNPEFIKTLRSRVPKITGTTMEERAVTGSEAKGCLDLIEAIEIDLQQDLAQQTQEPGFIQ